MNIVNKTILALVGFSLVPLVLAVGFTYQVETRHAATQCSQIRLENPGTAPTPLSDTGGFFLLFMFVVALMSIFAGLIVARSLVSPLRLLATAVSDFASHPERRIIAPATINGHDEVSILWREFQSMSQEIMRYHEDLETEVRKRTEDLEAFSYSVSHDLRAPLRAMDGFVQVLAQEYGDRLDAEGARILGIIQDNAKRMGQLIDDLLAFSRLGRQEIKKAPVAMKALVQSVINDLQHSERRRLPHITIGHLPDALADSDMLRLAWMNLLSNAVKFSGSRKDARVEVWGVEEADHVTYVVRDNGVGFDMRYADKLFKVFQRLHSAKEFEGTGVGLANVKRIVERHGGSVHAEGIVGKGATFSFTIPTRSEG